MGDATTAGGWRDMADAPRDGTFVLVWSPIPDGDPEDCIHIAYCDGNGKSWDDPDRGWVKPDPTHWQPLPAPPEVRDA